MQAVDWQQIVKEYGPIVWRTAYRLLGNHTDAADCFQETFVSALEVARRQRVRHFPALLVQLATARAIDRLRQRFRYPQLSIDAVDLIFVPNEDPGPVEQVQTQELAGRLRKALAYLPPKQAQVFCLRYFNELSYGKIAKQLGIRTNTARVLLHRARMKLHTFFDSSIVREEK